MGFSAEELKNLQDAIKEDWPKKCAFCGGEGNENWELIQGYLTIIATHQVPLLPAPEQLLLPNAIVVCKTCGNTVLLNLNILGIPMGIQVQQPNREQRRHNGGS